MTGINQQTFTTGSGSYFIDKSGLYNIQVIGGQGGSVLSADGKAIGLGGRTDVVSGQIHLDAGTYLKYVAASAGQDVGSTLAIGGGGGGGASYAYIILADSYNPNTPTLLMASGGGGGASKASGTVFSGGDGVGAAAPNLGPAPAEREADPAGHAGGGGADFRDGGPSYLVNDLARDGMGGNGYYPDNLNGHYGWFEGGLSDFAKGGFGGGGSGEFVVGYGGGGAGYRGGNGGNSDDAPFGRPGLDYFLPTATKVAIQQGIHLGDGSVSVSLVRADVAAPAADLAAPLQILAYDTGAGETAGAVARLYDTAFNRKQDASGAGYWINSLDKGASLQSVATALVNSNEHIAMYGVGQTNAQFVQQLYTNTLDRSADNSGLAYWTNELNTGHMTRGEVLASISESVEAVAHNAQLVAQGVQYQPWLS